MTYDEAAGILGNAMLTLEQECEKAKRSQAWCIEHSEELTHTAKAAWSAAQRGTRGTTSPAPQRLVCVISIDIRVSQDNPSAHTTARSTSFAQIVREVRCRPFKEVSRLLEDNVVTIGPGLHRSALVARLESQLEELPDAIPVMIVNQQAKWPFKFCPTHQSISDAAGRMQFDWLGEFKHTVVTRSAQMMSRTASHSSSLVPGPSALRRDVLHLSPSLFQLSSIYFTLLTKFLLSYLVYCVRLSVFGVWGSVVELLNGH
ncbi:hypothetical protein BV25DRAFT_1920752 [Artomyces pyxidatus]|uniref:Uncharacterized protein n=1 Tax=Artomyces pyxidatus TaxID=48021 RepID=A0ACB8SLY9_9AGAM|nr:hypothetical protein BV25DRAFT_1920752 [Artomyces pyxidatus]